MSRSLVANRPTSAHRVIRAFTQWYPFRRPCYTINEWLGKRFRFDGDEPQWLATKARGELPALVLNVANRYQRKLYYFLRVFHREYTRSIFAQFLKRELEPGDVVLDIGAHLGCYSFMAARLVGKTGVVHAFEPDPQNLYSLQQSAPMNCERIRVHGVAVADQPGVLPFHRTTAQSHSLLALDGNDARYTGEVVEVPVTTLDLWSNEHAIDRVDLIKVDVEGVEARTLAGGLKFLERTSRPPIWCEVRGPEGSKRAPSTFKTVVETLAPLGYRPSRWSRNGETPVEVKDVIGREDILFRAAPR